jgi:hypothetical protein
LSPGGRRPVQGGQGGRLGKLWQQIGEASTSRAEHECGDTRIRSAACRPCNACLPPRCLPPPCPWMGASRRPCGRAAPSARSISSYCTPIHVCTDTHTHTPHRDRTTAQSLHPGCPSTHSSPHARAPPNCCPASCAPPGFACRFQGLNVLKYWGTRLVNVTETESTRQRNGIS